MEQIFEKLRYSFTVHILFRLEGGGAHPGNTLLWLGRRHEGTVPPLMCAVVSSGGCTYVL